MHILQLAAFQLDLTSEVEMHVGSLFGCNITVLTDTYIYGYTAWLSIKVPLW